MFTQTVTSAVAVLDQLLVNTHLTTRWYVWYYSLQGYTSLIICNVFAQQYTGGYIMKMLLASLIIIILLLLMKISVQLYVDPQSFVVYIGINYVKFT